MLGQPLVVLKSFTGACIFTNTVVSVSFTRTSPTMSGANITQVNGANINSSSIPNSALTVQPFDKTAINTFTSSQTFNNPIILGYTTVNTNLNTIGGYQKVALTIPSSLVSNTGYNLGGVSGLSNGLYLINYCIVLNNSSGATPTTITTIQTGLANSSTQLYPTSSIPTYYERTMSQIIPITTASYLSYTTPSQSAVYQVTSSSNNLLYLTFKIIYSGGLPFITTNSYFTISRIG